MWQRKHVVEIRNRKQFKLPRCSPSFFGRRLTFGTMAIAATVVTKHLKTTPRAALVMSAEHCGSAVHDLLNHFAVTQREPVRTKKILAVLAKDVRQFKPTRCLGRRSGMAQSRY
jgi:hypothetical protein